MSSLEVGNTWTHMLRVDPNLLQAVDYALRYPTQLAFAQQAGFTSPENQWDGWIRLVRYSQIGPPRFPTGLLGRVKLLAQNQGYDLEIKDLRTRPVEGFPECGAIPLRDYQEAAVSEAVSCGRGVLDMPPRSGKTRTMCELHRRLSLPTIWIAPTDRIVTQTVEVIESFFGKNYALQLVGTKELPQAMNRHVVVCTMATAGMLPPEFYRTREMLVCDEWHHGAAKTYRQIFDRCDHIFYRFGMTGTFFRSGEDEMAMHSLLSHTIFQVDAKELEERGYLVPTRVVFVPVEGMLRGVGQGSYHTSHGKYGIQEHVRRNTLAAYATILLHQVGRKVLVLVNTKKQGDILAKMIGAFMPPKVPGVEFNPVEFISTNVMRPIQTRMIEAFLDSDEVKVLIGTSLLGEGVDLPAVSALVYARGEKAEVSLTQNAYRVCTKYGDKKDGIIVDFADRHHRKLFKHSKERLAVYHSIPIFDVTVLQSMNDFVDWLKGAK